jgi:copper chaperone CopZ
MSRAPISYRRSSAKVDSGPHCAMVSSKERLIMDQVEPVQGAEALETREIAIAGMGCDNCVRKLERALRAKEGVKDVRVDGIAGRATVTFDGTKTNVSELHEVIVKSGYRAGAVEVAAK